MKETCLTWKTFTFPRIHTSSTRIKRNPPGAEKYVCSFLFRIPETARQLNYPKIPNDLFMGYLVPLCHILILPDTLLRTVLPLIGALCAVGCKPRSAW
jgi:hypothetical protein